MAGWAPDDDKTYSTIHVLHVWNDTTKTNVKDLYAKLKRNWGTPDETKTLRSSYKLDTCLNCVKIRKEYHAVKKQDPNFLYNRARQKVIREMKKTGKLPKRSTLEKYNIELG
jgi:hypothetical protein